MKALINRLRMAQKFGLVALIAGVMLAVPSILVLRDGLSTAEASRAALSGLPPAGATLELIRLTQQHRGLSNGMLAGNAAMVAPRQAKQAEVQKALATAHDAIHPLGEGPVQKLMDQMAERWEQLAKDVSGRAIPGPQSFARHTALIAEQLDLLEEIANRTGIVLESESALYFLQASLLRTLPAATEALGQMRARGSALLTRGEASAEDRARFDALVQQFQRALRDSERLLALATQQDEGLRGRVDPLLTGMRTSSAAAMTLVGEHILRAEKLSYPAVDYFAATTRTIDDQFKVIDAGFALLDERLKERASAARGRLLMLAASLLAMAVLAGWVIWVATRTTTQALGSALQLARAVAAGDLRQHLRPEGGDEIAEMLKALSAMNDGLAHVVRGVRQNAESVATASAEIAQGNLDLSGRTEQQAAALEQTAATMDELGATVRQTAEHAREASALAQGASDVAQRGSQAVGQVVQTMHGINESSRRIAEITGTIDSIAFQTNILALNAAVEAARAGEQGRGFAVVAGEVRLLAQRAAEAARQIKQLIAESVQRVEQGTNEVDRAGATMAELVAAIGRVREIAAEISSASSEQSTGVSQVGEAVTQMDHTTQQNAALVEESAAAAESLRAQATQLLQAVSSFRLDGDPGPAA